VQERIMKCYRVLTVVLLLTGVTACNSNPPKGPACELPAGPDLNASVSSARFDLETGCADRFDSYFERLMSIAEGDPKKENKAVFSDFLLWANQQGLLSKRQARRHYNRYFGVKFVSLMSDYSVCSDVCPRQQQLLSEMRDELADKERGLLKVSADPVSYQRASQLYRETELVFGATCAACRPVE
jgi:hypothetical protein